MKKNKNPQLIKAFNYGFYFITFIWSVIGAVYLYDTFQDRKQVFTPLESIELFQNEELLSGTQIGIITPHDHVKVLRILFIKGQFVAQIQTSKREIGWILKPKNL
jgi:hypothetical protein